MQLQTSKGVKKLRQASDKMKKLKTENESPSKKLARRPCDAIFYHATLMTHIKAHQDTNAPTEEPCTIAALE